MESASAKLASLLEYGTAARPLHGETVSGDKYVVTSVPGGVLLAVIDGLGHGPEAAKAAEVAAAVLEAHAHEALIALVSRCHEALRTTRGVAMSVAVVSATVGTVTWVGVGNVEGVLVRAERTATPSRETLLTRGGIVGYQLPPLRASVIPVRRGDLLALATDGIASTFSDDVEPGVQPQRIADRILDKHAKDTDDALVLVARWQAHEAGRGA